MSETGDYTLISQDLEPHRGVGTLNYCRYISSSKNRIGKYFERDEAVGRGGAGRIIWGDNWQCTGVHIAHMKSVIAAFFMGCILFGF